MKSRAEAPTGQRPAGRRRHRRGRRRPWRSRRCALALAAAMPGAASAAAPTATTGGATDVELRLGDRWAARSTRTASDDLLLLPVRARRTAYGGQTAIGSTPARATKASPVAAGRRGPAAAHRLPLPARRGQRRGHRRSGDDRTFQTTKVPLSLAILASPNPVAVRRRRSSSRAPCRAPATPAAGRAAGQRRSPSRRGFAAIGNPELTTADGRASPSPLLGLAQTSTQFRVVTTTNPPWSQPGRDRERRRAGRAATWHARAGAASRALRHGDARPRTACRSGSCASRTATACSSAARSCATASATSSSFSRVVRVHKGVYRVLVRVVGAAQVSSYSQPLLIR